MIAHMLRTASRVPRLLPRVLVVLLPLLAGNGRAAAEPPAASFDALATTVRKAVESDKPEDALRAYARIGPLADPRAVDLVLDTAPRVVARRDALVKEQTDAATTLENALAKIEKANATTPITPRDIAEYNKRTRKLEADRDAATVKLRDLGLDIAQWKAVLAAASSAVGLVIETLPRPKAEEGLAKLTAAWFGPKGLPESKIRWLDAVSAVKTLPVGPQLRAISMDEVEDVRVRVVALSVRVARVDADVVADTVALLASKDWPLAAEAIEGLRRLHCKEAIEPLIAFLGREDIGRLRSDAHRALRSLTGQKHGPFQQPWKDWWEVAKPTFVLPEKPADAADLARPEKGLTFYGVTTFSDKILFVLDVSGSMLDPARGDPNAPAKEGERKIDAARRELKGALGMLDPSKKFNIIFFANKVIRYQVGMVVADKSAVELATRFAMDIEPVGGTNIHDALEAAFRIAGTAADGKNYASAVDTIYFMTDGTPTVGKLKKPEEILAAVREWNRTAHITIHGIGVGAECDAVFLKALADENGGVFVKR